LRRFCPPSPRPRDPPETTCSAPSTGKRPTVVGLQAPEARRLNILGVSAYYHDSAACLVQDGRIVAAAQPRSILE